MVRFWAGSTLFCGLLFAVLGLYVAPNLSPEKFGTLIYNYLFLSFVDGRLDVPLQIASWEGHITADGRAYIYQGPAPIVTRLIAWPFVDLTTASLSAATIWVFAVAGNAVWSHIFLAQLSKVSFDSRRTRLIWNAVTCFAVWALAPGLLLIANDSYYQEPIAIAYFLTALFCAVAVANHQRAETSLIALAVIAGLVVLARPNIAPFLFGTVVILAARHLWQDGWQGVRPVLASMIILLTFGLSILGYNHARFGMPLEMHGALSSALVEMAYTYFDVIPDGAGLQAYAENGQFNIQRLPAGFVINAFEINSFPAAFRELASTDPRAVKSFGPFVGFVWLWLPFIALAAVGLFTIRRASFTIFVLVAAFFGIGLLLSTYFASTLRYRFEYWPLIGLLAALGLPKVAAHLDFGQTRSRTYAALLAMALTYSVVLSVIVFTAYANSLIQTPVFGNWSQPVCAHYVSKRNELGEDAAERLCYLDLES